MCEIHVKYVSNARVSHFESSCVCENVKYAYNIFISCVDVTYFWDLWISRRDSRCVLLFAWFSQRETLERVMETAPDHDNADNTKMRASEFSSRVSRLYAKTTQIKRLVGEACYRSGCFNELQSESHVLTFQNAVLLRLNRCPYFLRIWCF